MTGTAKPTVYHIPVRRFSQRLEILLALKGIKDPVQFQVVDIQQVPLTRTPPEKSRVPV